MESSTYRYEQNELPSLPFAKPVLVLGTLSLCLFWCCGFYGLAPGIIALILARRGNMRYIEDGGQYSDASYRQLRTGKTCATIGVILSAVMTVVFTIVYILAILVDAGFDGVENLIESVIV